MATRRIISTEKTILDQDDESPIVDNHQQPSSSSSSSPPQSIIAPAVPLDVILKLLAFTVAMVVVPIGSYFATVNTVFKGNSSYAGGLAALMANVVLLGYVIVAMNEDQSEQLAAKAKETKKGR
ncbi:vacuolar ATPase assembly integral membrane protein vma21 [Diatrype stigma]|uniref:Vacuolar ATPase assembly integral membrane protein vma21 n=1 Tax=Diatrype stigma TaxID=117547 RepID=A0AAN9YS09_9PEZI